MKTTIIGCALLLASALVPGPATAAKPSRSYRKAVRRVARMVRNWRARRLVRRQGLRIVNVMWEDTGRYYGSSVGPNISDVTIEVETGRGRSALMPVIRYPNFSDKTGDVKLDQLYIRVGNQNKHGVLQTIPLRELLLHPARYMSYPQRGRISRRRLLAKRDTHVLVSAQAAFLPIPGSGTATFWPVIFNYQSYEKNPAVLTLLVTRQGTSMTIVDNARHTVADSWGQRLFFNKGGMRAPLTAERLSTVRQRGSTANGESTNAVGEDANMLMLIQIPLRQRPRRRRAAKKAAPAKSLDALGAKGGARAARGRSDVERAVLGHGPIKGRFTELDWLTVRRDPRFPIRVTIQFYQATSSGAIDAGDVERLHARIKKVYASADYVGSLVLPDGERPTMWTGATSEPGGLSWRDFPGLMQRFQRFGWYRLGRLIS